MKYPERRWVEAVPMSVCENGHCADKKAIPQYYEQLKHKCGSWTWADGRYCMKCGAKL